MVFNWLDASAAKTFGESLADFYAQRLPPSYDASQKQFAAKTSEVLSKMEPQVARFKSDNKLNVYKTAQLGNAFKWKLKDLGYPDPYIDRLTEWLVARL